MSDATPPESGRAALDLARVSAPGVDGFRALAQALGVRFAGDGTVEGTPPGGDGAPQKVEGRPASRDVGFEALLEKLPLSVVVARGSGTAFLNRSAKRLLGYTSEDAFDAAGGLPSLFADGRDGAGTMRLSKANGTIFTANVRAVSLRWGQSPAVMLLIEPQDDTETASAPSPSQSSSSTPSPHHGETLMELLSANPDPMAVVRGDGTVESANRAYRDLSPIPGLDLQSRTGPAQREVVHGLISAAFASAQTVVRSPQPIDIGGAPVVVSAGVLSGSERALVVFHREVLGADSSGKFPELPSAQDRPVAAAAHQAARLLEDAGINVRVEGVGSHPLEHRRPEEVARFFRSVLLLMGARAPTGATITLTARTGHYELAMDPPDGTVAREVASSSRLVLFGLEAGFAVSRDDDQHLTIAPIV